MQYRWNHSPIFVPEQRELIDRLRKGKHMTDQIGNPEFPDINLDHLHARVASGRPGGITSLTPEELAACPAGTILRDRHPDDPDQYAIWVYIEGGQVARVHHTFETPSYNRATAPVMAVTQLANAIVVGRIPPDYGTGTP